MHLYSLEMNSSIKPFFLFYSPNIESMAMRFGMMKDHRSTTGEVVAFDGSILYLPVKLNNVSIILIVVLVKLWKMT